ncbi:MAG: hypothetical protein IKP97_03565 [Kiritimatiellae bacterium]|nr:hypothetical protein [Kiritimatiellia bacterium]
MDRSGESIAEVMRQIDSLGFWPGYLQWVLLPRGSVYPYFGMIEPVENHAEIKAQGLFLEGWQTFHDYNLWRHDREYGFVSYPGELPGFFCLWLKDGRTEVYRQDPGFKPRPLVEREEPLFFQLIRESFGLVMRIENDPKLCHRYLDEGSLFGRRQTDEGPWEDVPVPMVQPRPHVEHVTLPKADVAAAKDLPLLKDRALEVDFRCNPAYATQEAHSRIAYDFLLRDAQPGQLPVRLRFSVRPPQCTLADMWQNLAPCLLKEMVKRGFVPGEIRVRSQRVFRLLRPLTLQLPFKLSLHDSLPGLDINA